MDCAAVYCVGMCCGAVARCVSCAEWRESGYGLRGRIFVVFASSWWHQPPLWTCEYNKYPSTQPIATLSSLSTRRTPSHCSTTQHDMLPQHLVCKYELNYEYCNITLAGNKAPWWWSDKIETCRGVLKVFYMKLYVHSLVDRLKWFYENARCYNKIYVLFSLTGYVHGSSV